jgi:hypothetical protein
VSRKIVYSQYVVFKEFGSKSEPKEIVQIENNLEKVRFKLRNEEDDSDESTESEGEVEQLTPIVSRSEWLRKPVERYSSPDFHSTFVLTATDNEPKSVGEAVDSTEGKIWKEAMVEELESLHNNETWDLVKLRSGKNHVSNNGYSRRR